jgi:hypothetical protein
MSLLRFSVVVPSRLAAISLEPEWMTIRRAADNSREGFRQAVTGAAAVSRNGLDLFTFNEFVRGRKVDEACALAGETFRDALRGPVEASLRGLLQRVTGGYSSHVGRYGIRIGAGKTKPVKARLDLTNQAAADWIKEHGGELIEGLSARSRAAVRAALLRSFERGIPTDKTAREIRRVISLTDGQELAVERLRLRLEEDAEDEAAIERQLDRYADKLLADRAENIARTETIQAANEGQRIVWLDAAEQGLLDPEEVERVWIVTPDDRLCPICEGLEGATADLDGTFRDAEADGEELSGPPAHNQCRCAQGLQPRGQARAAAATSSRLRPLNEACSGFHTEFLRMLGGPGSGNFGHGGRPGEVGGSGEGSGDVPERIISAVQKQITWEGNRVVVARGGTIPEAGSIFFSTDAGLAADYAQGGRTYATYVIQKSAIIEEGTKEWESIFPKLQSESADFFTSPPPQVEEFLSTHPWVAGIASAGGQYIHVKNPEAAKIKLKKEWVARDAGGVGSGNFGHAGIPGQVGGSAPGEGGVAKGPATRAKDRRKEYNAIHKKTQAEYRKQRNERLRREKLGLGPEKLEPVQPAPAPALPDASPGGPAPPSDDVSDEYVSSPEHKAKEDALSTPLVKDQKILGGGITESYVVTLDNGQKAVFKPETRPLSPEEAPAGHFKLPEGETGKIRPEELLRRGITGKVSEREAAAWEVAKLGGADDLVAPTVVREINGKKGSLQAFVPNAKTAYAVVAKGGAEGFARSYGVTPGQEDRATDDLQRAAMFDYIIGNQDRHQGNWMVSDDDGRIKLIDHGLSFGETRAEHPTFNQKLLYNVTNPVQRGMEFASPREVARKYVANRGAIKSTLTKLGLPQKSVDRTMRRILKASQAGSWKDLYGDGF